MHARRTHALTRMHAPTRAPSTTCQVLAPGSRAVPGRARRLVCAHGADGDARGAAGVLPRSRHDSGVGAGQAHHDVAGLVRHDGRAANRPWRQRGAVDVLGRPRRLCAVQGDRSRPRRHTEHVLVRSARHSTQPPALRAHAHSCSRTPTTTPCSLAPVPGLRAWVPGACAGTWTTRARGTTITPTTPSPATRM